MDSEKVQRGQQKEQNGENLAAEFIPLEHPLKKRKEDCRENSKNSMRLRRGPRRKDTNMSGAKLKVRKLKDHF